jgi:hypothetical protein
MRPNPRQYWRLAAVALLGLMTALVAYRLGHERGWRDAEATVLQAGLDSARHETLQAAAQGFQAGYERGRLGAVIRRRQTRPPPAQPASCLTCHAGAPHRPEMNHDRDRSGIQIRYPYDRKLNATHLLIWHTSDQRCCQ